MACALPYIPNHLLQNGREALANFTIGEYLYYRCTEAVKLNPFDGISLVDLSNNRSGTRENFLSHPEDVLFNTNPTAEKPQEKFDLAIACLEIVELNGDNLYLKEFKDPEIMPPNDQLPIQFKKVAIHLKHKPIDCNYSHCAFEFYHNDIEVTFDNYLETLGHKASKKLRTKCKQEISKMIIKEVIRINYELPI